LGDKSAEAAIKRLQKQRWAAARKRKQGEVKERSALSTAYGPPRNAIGRN